jgi:hypothetical protein
MRQLPPAHLSRAQACLLLRLRRRRVHPRVLPLRLRPHLAWRRLVQKPHLIFVSVYSVVLLFFVGWFFYR